jgi:D-lactate dehydrogenase
VSVAGAQAPVERIAPEPPGDWPVPRPAPDAAPDWVAHGTPPELAGPLARALGDGGLAGRASDLIRYASDASCYRSIPRAVAVPRDIVEVAAVMAVARETATPLVFRAGGTSLNGQSQTDGILLDCRRHFKDVAIEDGGARVRVQPGAVLGRVNRRLIAHGPASAPTPRAPRSHASAGCLRTTPAACAAGSTPTPTGRCAR